LTCCNPAASAVVRVRFLRNQKNYRARIASRITRRSNLPNFPFAPDAERNVGNFAPFEIGERDDCHLAARFCAHVFGNSVEPLDSCSVENMREIIYEASGRRNCGLLRENDAWNSNRNRE